MSKNSKINWDKLQRVARDKFGIDDFRPGQPELIEAALTHRDALGILPTGAGKSLCFQLPSLLLPGATIVVSPLIALMQDQTEKMDEVGIDAARLDSTLNSSEQKVAKRAIEEGESRLVYVTPERLEQPEYLETLKQSNVKLFVVDEAHCISQWGHDFRPAYLNLRNAIHELGRPPVMALTATATEEVLEDIIKQLDLHQVRVIRASIDRPNLVFNVHNTVNDEIKKNRLLELVTETAGSVIVYTATVAAAEELGAWLSERMEGVAVYHGKLKTAQREKIQQAFMDNETRVVVATKAFGLGIDKPDVRLVVHFQFPDSVESYYQEAGRAGRDGEKATASLLYKLEDKRIQSYFLGGKYPSPEDCWRIYTAASAFGNRGTTIAELATATALPAKKVKVVIAYLNAAGIIERKRRLHKTGDFESPDEMSGFLQEFEQRHTSDQDRLNNMMHYAQTLDCRVKFLRRYFGEPEGEACRICDNCTNVSNALWSGAA